ncbi:MAG: phosphoribosylaminoimidazolesuccinocarboxamide synthase [Candidatus Saccharibacteria bacterium]|nr:phosphoribosylaminoimidazolesuccinocarboxamide synthase [Candidatus Saccharibacteria bacterium]
MKVMTTNAISTTDFEFPEQTKVYHGKVRDVYTINDDILVAVATDRISAFDVILPRPIPFKGQVLNQLAEYFLNKTTDILPNWLISVPDPSVSIGHKLEPYKIEMVVRGGLVGHAAREYNDGKRELCGVAMPDGLQEYDMFPSPIITPSTKADAGHDEDISAEKIIETGLATTDEFVKLSDYALQLFARGQELARERGLVLMDTKYEFGKNAHGEIYVIDEIHTPDSSRYFYGDTYDAYLADRTQEQPRHLSKEFVREWLMERNFSGQTGETIPEMTDEFVTQTSDRYIELFEQLSGQTFERPSTDIDPIERIKTNVTNALKGL